MIDLTLIAIIVFGFINSYTDIKSAKIKNVLIILMIAAGLVLNFYFNSFTTDTVLNSLISIGLGFMLFYYNYWSAGDAKLFFAFTLLVPISIYHFGKVSFFPSISILINSFVPVTIFYFFVSLRKINTEKIMKSVKNMSKPETLLITVLFLFGFSVIFKILNVKLDVLSSTFILFLLFQILGKYRKRYTIALFGFLSVLNFIVQESEVLTLSYLINFLLVIAIYGILNILLSFISGFSFSSKTAINSLRPGMISGEPLYYRNDKFDYKPPGEKITKLTEKDISNLKMMFKSGKLKSILIEKAIPFAPFIFLGVLLTYFFQGNFFSFVYLIYLKPYLGLI